MLTDTTVGVYRPGHGWSYVADGVERILAYAGDRDVPIVVVGSSPSADWKHALGDKADDAHAGQRAERLLDDLRRAAALLVDTDGTTEHLSMHITSVE